MNREPIKLEAPVKSCIWGGRRLIEEFGKKTDNEIAAESWELSTHPDGESIVKTGASSGKRLSEYIAENEGCLGKDAAKFSFFPVLIKLIDAKSDLSVQVHPDNEYALRTEGGYGKTEMWYIVDCDEGAYLYYGLNRAVTKEEFSERIKNNTLLEILNKVSIKKGDVFFIPAGTIHAICAGTLICEIQQNSNITYRIYDYGRTDADGRPRELHTEKAAAVSRLTPSPAQKQRRGNILAACEYFTVSKIEANGRASLKLDTGSFRSLVILDGEGSVSAGGKTIAARKGDSIFIPAQDGTAELNGKMTVIVTRV